MSETINWFYTFTFFGCKVITPGQFNITVILFAKLNVNYLMETCFLWHHNIFVTIISILYKSITYLIKTMKMGWG